MSTSHLPLPPDPGLSPARRGRHLRLRLYRDRLATLFIMLGGLGVVLSVLLMLFYLLHQVIPLLTPARITAAAQTTAPLPGQGIYLALDAGGQTGVRLTAGGRMQFFRPSDNMPFLQLPLKLPSGTDITALTDAGDGLLVLLLGDGRILPVQRHYQDLTGRHPVLSYPLGETPLQLQPTPVQQLTARRHDNMLELVSFSQGQLTLFRLDLTREAPPQQISLPTPGFEPRQLRLMLPASRLLVLGPEGRIGIIPLAGSDRSYQVVRASEHEITLFELLPGQRSLIIGDQAGQLSQWFFVPDQFHTPRLRQIRSFSSRSSTPLMLAGRAEDNSFVTLEENGTLSLYSLTSSRARLQTVVLDTIPEYLALAPDSDHLWLEGDRRISRWQLQAPHAEITFSSLWQRLWHEGYEAPEYIWHSSANGTDSAAKYSLLPLIFGTLKAALYAMLLATPLAICGAIYTACFMAAPLRRKIKPVIEMMAAIPSVVLGFLAAAWLAPFMQTHLAAILLLILLLPFGILLFALGWEKMPQRIRFLLPEGWDFLLLLGLLPLLAWLIFPLAATLENGLFDGSLIFWLGEHTGIRYDQRNALIAGIAMGFAIIPTLFSLTEDAIHAVPPHLSQGALALGATRWQALVMMTLPAASAGIFSALMIGLGRALGETMIVLMVAGNTPIMELNLFEGLRSLAANIAIEMPESQAGSSHYRVLFLTALLLFLFTLIVNTLAELMRQQLRRRYRAL